MVSRRIRTESEVREDEARFASLSKDAVDSFAFLRRNRSAARRAEAIGEHMLMLTSFRSAQNGALDNVEFISSNGLPGTECVATRPTIITEDHEILTRQYVSLRQRNSHWIHGLGVAQLVASRGDTYLSSAEADFVMVTASPRGDERFMGPLGIVSVTPEFVEAVDAVLTDHLIKNDLPLV